LDKVRLDQQNRVFIKTTKRRLGNIMAKSKITNNSLMGFKRILIANLVEKPLILNLKIQKSQSLENLDLQER
jgi:hypothetical protein